MRIIKVFYFRKNLGSLWVKIGGFIPVGTVEGWVWLNPRDALYPRGKGYGWITNGIIGVADRHINLSRSRKTCRGARGTALIT